MEIIVGFFDDSNDPITGGAASTTIKLRRVTDGYLFDFDDSTFKASGWTTVADALAEVDATNLAGYYKKVITISGFNDGNYQVFVSYSDAVTRNGDLEVIIKDGEIINEIVSTFDPASDEVDIGAVKGSAVSGVNDFKATGFSTHAAADVWSVATRRVSDATNITSDAGTIDQTKIANLDAAVSTRSTLTAQGVWEYATRTLSSFGTLVSDMATAVWGAVARTLTGGVTVTTNNDKTGYALTSAYDSAKAAMQAGAEVDIGSVKGSAVTSIDDFKADVSDLATAAELESQRFADGCVYLKSDSGLSGTSYPNGTANSPVNNLSDALSIASANDSGTIKVVFTGAALSVSTDLVAVKFIGRNYYDAIISLSGDGRVVCERCCLTGTSSTDNSEAYDCVIYLLVGLGGDIYNSQIALENTVLALATLYNCRAAIWGAAPSVSIAGATFTAYNWSGDLTIKNGNGSTAVYMTIQGGTITIDSSCTGGTYNFSGVGTVINNGGVGLTVVNNTVPYNPLLDDDERIPATVIAAQADIPSVSGIEAVTDKLDTMLEADGDVSRFTENALEETPNTDVSTLESWVDAIKTETDKLGTMLELDGDVSRFTENALEEAPVPDVSGLATQSSVDTLSTNLLRGLGLMMENHVEDDIVRNAQGLKTSSKFYLYDSSAHATTHDKVTGVIAAYTVSVSYDGSGRVTLFKVVKD